MSLGVPFLVFRLLRSGESVRDMLSRFGLPFPAPVTGKRVVSFHAASMGEVTGLLPLVRRFQQECPECALILTTTSRTGREAGQTSNLFDEVMLQPYDHPIVLRAWFQRFRPVLLVIAETEIWPNSLLEAAARHIPVVMVNARISDYSAKNYRRFARLVGPVLSDVSKILVQTEIDAQRFQDLGVDEARIEVAGSSKYDFPMIPSDANDRSRQRLAFGLDPAGFVFVAGSIRPGEDEVILDALVELEATGRAFQAVLAPRHPDQFERVAGMLEARKLRFIRRSTLRHGDGQQGFTRYVLLDTLGELRGVYALADSAFVGATLVDIGGHNPLEPAAYGIPIIVGPYTRNVRDAVEDLQREGAHILVRNRAECVAILTKLIDDPKFRSELGAASRRVALKHSGASAKLSRCLTDVLARRAA